MFRSRCGRSRPRSVVGGSIIGTVARDEPLFMYFVDAPYTRDEPMLMYFRELPYARVEPLLMHVRDVPYKRMCPCVHVFQGCAGLAVVPLLGLFSSVFPPPSLSSHYTRGLIGRGLR